MKRIIFIVSCCIIFFISLVETTPFLNNVSVDNSFSPNAIKGYALIKYELLWKAWVSI